MAKFIFSTDIIPQKVRFLAEEYHRRKRDTHIQAATIYRVSDRNDGSGGTEWLLTRYHDKAEKAYSSILLMEHGGKAEFLHELFFNERKNEKAMLDAWKAFVEEEDDD
jgi:hypothetical protein